MDLIWILNTLTEQLNILFLCPSWEKVVGVAYSAQTDVLFVVATNHQRKTFILRAFTRTNFGWRERNQCDIPVGSPAHDNEKRCTMRVLNDQLLVFGEWMCSNRLHVLSQTPQLISTIELPFHHFGFDAKLECQSILIAAAYWSADSVVLLRVVGERAEEVTRIKCNFPWQPLFYKDTMIVFRQTDYGAEPLSEVAQLLVQPDRLQEFRLLRSVPFYWFRSVCIIGEKLHGFDAVDKKIKVYEIDENLIYEI